MQRIIRIFVSVMLLISNGCYAQQLVKTPNDAKKVKDNEKLFINKPLKEFLKEIKSKIIMVTANTNAYADKPGIGYFNFRFLEPKQYDSVKSKGKTPIAITVYVKGNFEWELKKRDANGDVVNAPCN